MVDASVGTLDVAGAFRRHYRFVWRTVACMGVPISMVDDAVQDVFMTAHRRRSDFDGRRSEKGWLFGIARMVCRNYRRKSARSERQLRRPRLVEAHPLPEEHLAHVRAIELVDQWLGKMAPRHRDVFMLAEIEGMTAPEISEVLGVKLNTVYSRIRVARRRFEAMVAHDQRKEGRPHGRVE